MIDLTGARREVKRVSIIRPHTGNPIWQSSGEMPLPDHTNGTAASLERTPDQSPDLIYLNPES